jgi:uncharacterized protein YndB with AHSA1/START domain
MSSLQLTKVPASNAAILIRRPISEVFEAFVNPEITTKFWFTKGSGRLDTGKPVQWDWEMYKVSVQVVPQSVEKNKRLVIEWSGYGSATTVEWTFTERRDGTFVSVSESGFTGTGDEVVDKALGSTGGFTLLMAGAKAYLEHNLQLHLVRDRFPPEPSS